MPTRQLIIPGGPNGAGKSGAHAELERLGFVTGPFLNPDDIASSHPIARTGTKKQENTMGIIVEWGPKADPGTEYIDDIDLDNLENCPAQMQTKFWSPDGDGGEFGMWEVEVRVEPPTDDRTVLVVKYDEEQNPEEYRGENRTIVVPEQNHGDYC